MTNTWAVSIAIVCAGCSAGSVSTVRGPDGRPAPAASDGAHLDAGAPVRTDAGDAPPLGADDAGLGVEICTPEETRPCWTGDLALAGVGECTYGEQACETSGEFGGTWGACGGEGVPLPEECANAKDDDCDGAVDEDCPDPCMLVIDLSGDCLTVECPPACPFPVACDVRFDGSDGRGCVASRPDRPTVYFQEGDKCGSGSLRGTLTCSPVMGSDLDDHSCFIDRDEAFYADDPDECPETH